jgi:hypothetical protein
MDTGDEQYERADSVCLFTQLGAPKAEFVMEGGSYLVGPDVIYFYGPPKVRNPPMGTV